MNCNSTTDTTTTTTASSSGTKMDVEDQPYAVRSCRIHHRRRRLKGLLSLLPETGILYPYQEQGRNDNNNSTATDTTTTATISSSSSSFLTATSKTKITSRKQQKRLLKRYMQSQQQQQQHERLRQEANGNEEDIESNNPTSALATTTAATTTIIMKQEIHLLSDMIQNDIDDVVVLFLFDPYQSYSLQLLHQYIAISKLSCLNYINNNSTSTIQHPFNNNNNNSNNNNNNNNIYNENSNEQNESDPYNPNIVLHDNNYSNNMELSSSLSLSSSSIPSKLHCLVVTSCTDTVLIDQILQYSGIILLPWTSSNESWKVMFGNGNVLVCPSILGIIECQYGRNIFKMDCEELVLSSSSSSSSLSAVSTNYIYDCWYKQRKSALTMVQKIQAYIPFYPSSICTIQ